MVTQEVKRKLTAIFSADVKGYSRLMGEDEESTARTLNTYKEVMTGLIQHHHGRVVDAPGDNVLAEFTSVVDAVRCAVEIQKELKTRNVELPENRRMEFRMGVNLGDVIEEGDKILGDGVNIAARMESLAEAGGICASGTAFDQVKNKLNLGYKYLGEQTVKNILEPVRVYQVLMEPETAGKVIGEKKVKANQWKWTTIGLVAAVVVVVAAVAIWRLYLWPTPPPVEVASKEKMAFPLPDVPSIAVMPFVNMSGDPKQEFFCDGMTEAIITALSKLPGLFVIARTSTSTYKGKPVKVKQVSEELGVRYVLEGSIQRSTDRIRINAQFIDALTGHHLWAEKYDRDLKDIFALQDEITIKILTAVRVKLEGGDASRVKISSTGKINLDCYLKLMQAMGYWTRMNPADNNLARRMIEEAIAMCPENPGGYIHLSIVCLFDYLIRNTTSPLETLEKGIELAQKALAIDDSIPEAHGTLCRLYSLKGELDKAIAEGERAVALNPSGWGVLTNYGNTLTQAGRPEEAIPLLQKVIRLNPLGPAYIYTNLGVALRMTGRFEEAVSASKKSTQLAPDNPGFHAELAATYVMMGREEEARAEVAEVLRINPKFPADYAPTFLAGYKDPSVRLKVVDALRKAGLK
jgi:adenylate cyclase